MKGKIIRGCLMKVKTKKLIAWIKRILKEHERFTEDEADDYLINETRAAYLFDKFVEVEKQLQKGGIIQDVNKKLCMDGDKIREVDGEFREGVLSWDNIERHFCFDWENISEPLGDRDFEKIEGVNNVISVGNCFTGSNLPIPSIFRCWSSLLKLVEA